MRADILFGLYKWLAVAVTAWLCVGCAGKKQEPKYDLMENITARYNIVYHSRKIIDEVSRDNFAAHIENYQQRLPVFIEPTEATAASNAPLMDSVIGKALTVINEKSRSKYISEAYLLTGIANYLKGNYYNAAEFFTYTANTFAGQPQFALPALTWKARSLMQLGNLTESGTVLDTVFAQLESNPANMGLAFATQAKYYLLNGDGESAITMLLQALAHTSDKPTRLRWHYLLGQLLGQDGQTAAAYQHYSEVVNSNAPYEMAFHAALNRIFLSDTAGTDRVRLLQRMLRDGKNQDYKDQIYYQMAEVQYTNGHIAEAIEDYESSLRQQSNNRYQTTQTYLRLADHYFKQAAYTKAKHYYDSVGMNIPMDFPDAGPVQRKIANLDELIKQLQVVSHQDTLLLLAGLAGPQRDHLLDSIVQAGYAKIQEQEQLADQSPSRRGRASRMQSPFETDLFNAATTYTDNRFYFNNPDAMGMGMTEFRRKWGNRPLQDNWRYSDMATAGNISGNTVSPDTGATVAVADTALVDSAVWMQQQREIYLAELPDTPEKQQNSTGQIYDALLRIGELYRNELQDMPGAIDAYEKVLSRYPNAKDAAMIYYNLYLLYSEVNKGRADDFKSRLLAEFPDAIYSRIIRDPMYRSRMQEQKQMLDQAYETAYLHYTQARFPDVIRIVDSLSASIPEQQPALAQLAYLRALALGRTSGIDTFENVLKQITADFPYDSLITPLVNQHLAYIAENRDTLATQPFVLSGLDSSRSRFIDEPTMTLWPALVIRRGPDLPVQQRTLAVSNAAGSGIGSQGLPGSSNRLQSQQIARIAEVGEIAANAFRDKELLPDSATYYFVINVMNNRVNLAPSRYGIGQFNRTRYSGLRISHQLKTINDENQLIYIGPFDNFDTAKAYETRITPLIPEIMKIPASLYNTFLITAPNFGTLSDFDAIDDYYIIYHEQK